MSGPKGFVAAKVKKEKRLVVSVEGLQKEGKTSLALSAPGPIALLNLDTGLEGVVDKFIGKKKIYVAEFKYLDAVYDTMKPDEKQSAFRKMWKRVWDTYMDALKSKDIRSIVVDTFTEAYELQRLAAFGKLTNVMPVQYGPVNAELKEMVKRALYNDKNVIYLNRMRDVYKENKKGMEVRTGEVERAGWGKLGYEVQVCLRSYKDEDGMFGVRVVDCRHKTELEGEEYMIGDMYEGFKEVAMEIWEGSKEEDWE